MPERVSTSMVGGVGSGGVGRKRARGEKGAAGGAASSAAAPAPAPLAAAPRNRVLVFGGRGMSARVRHLLEDLRRMIPHHKVDSKVRGARRARPPPRPPAPASARSSTAASR